MAAQPEPIDLAELVILLYRADWTRLSLSAVVHARHDLAPRGRMSNVQATGEPDVITGGRVLIAPGGRCRLELARPDEDRGAGDDRPRLTVCDGESQWEVGDDAATREEAHDPPYPLADLLIPSRLLTEFDLELAGTAVAGGRVAYRVMITPRAARSGRGVIRDRHPDRGSALVDAELGILLSYEETFDGQPLKFAELTDLLLDPPAAAEPGQFLPPPGMPARDGGPPQDRGHPLPGVVSQAAGLVAAPVAAAIGFAARHLVRSSPGPSAQAADEAGIPVLPRATDRARLTPLTDDLVNLLYRTGLPPQVFTATAHERTDGAGITRMVAALRADLPSAIDGIFGPDQLWSAFGQQIPERIYEISRLTVAMPGRYRIDHLAGGQPTRPQTIACDGERLWKVYPNRVATGPPQPLYLDFGRLADQSCLLSGCELTAGGEAEVDGRRGFLVVADGVDGVDGPWPADLFPMTDHVEVVVDARLGIALRETCYFQGEPFHCIELREVSGQVDPGAFRIDVPVGTRTVGTGLFSDLDMPAPVKAARLAAGLGVAGVAALTGWLQKRPRR
jgi:outer membrane lipoprotein-sorting protein